MSLSEQIDQDTLTAAYLFANTPRYLYRHFRQNASIADLGRNVSSDRLVAEFNHRMQKETRSVDDIVVAYSILMALTFLEYQQALTAFQSCDLSRLDWGEEIKSIFESSAKPVNSFEAVFKPRSDSVRIRIDSSQNSFFCKVKPKFTIG